MSRAPSAVLDLLNHVPVGMGLFCAAVTWGLSGWTGSPPNVTWTAASGLLFFSLYTLNRWTDLGEDRLTQPERTAIVASAPGPLLALAVASGAASAALAARAGVDAAALVVPLAAVPVYSARWLPGRRRLKDVTAAKNLFVSAVTVYGTAGVAGALAGWPAGSVGYLTFAGVRVLLNNVLCDVPDAAGDRAQGVRTIPARFGVPRTLAALRGVNAVATVALLAPAWPAPPRVALVLTTGAAAEAVLRAAAAGRLSGARLKSVADLEVAAWPLLLAMADVLT